MTRTYEPKIEDLNQQGEYTVQDKRIEEPQSQTDPERLLTADQRHAIDNATD